MKKIAIFGAGGFGQEVAMLIEQINQHEYVWDLIGFYDDNVPPGTIVYGYEVIGSKESLNIYKDQLHVAIAISNSAVRKSVVSSFVNHNLIFPVLIHPNVLIGRDSTVNEGSIITAGNIITSNVNIGKHVILNLSCTVGHDVIINDYVSIMPGVNISGEVNIGENTFVGTGAKVIQQVVIGENVTLGAGAVVIGNLPDNCTAVGIPAMKIK
ncbi:acetyltransferase [Pontibacter sp. H259]|uniref:acetyltransferase n=1 Tax=Pontibacter sp. H259 TaxID=3133421 RepID=UPI0030BCC1E3